MPFNRTAWSALVDDDGSNTVGTLMTKTKVSDLIAPVIQTDTFTGSVNNFGLTADCRILRCTGATLRTYTGFTAGYDGQLLTILSKGAGQVDILHQSGSSTAANQCFNFATSGPTSGAPGVGRFDYYYDGTAQRWTLLQHEQGDWITPTFDALHYTGSGATNFSWTLTSPDRAGQAYWLRGRRLEVTFSLDLTSVVASPAAISTDLRILNTGWGNYTGAAQQFSGTVNLASDNGTVVPAFIQANASATYLRILKQSLAVWTAATNATTIYGGIILGVA